MPGMVIGSGTGELLARCMHNLHWLDNQKYDDVRKHFENKVYKTVIPRNVRISEAPSHGLPVLLYDTNCFGSKAYASLSAELILQEEKVYG